MSVLISNAARALLVATVVVTTPSGASAATHRAKSSPRPDLTVRGFTVQPGADDFQVDAQLANVGRRAAPPTSVVIALSTDPTLDPDDVVMDTSRIARTQAGKSKRISIDVPFPDESPTSPDGTLYVLICADPDGLLKEKSETNNCERTTIDSEVLGFTGDDDWSDSEGELVDDPADDPAAVDGPGAADGSSGG